MRIEILVGFLWANAGVEESLNTGDQRIVPDTVGRRWVKDGRARDLDEQVTMEARGPLAPPETKRVRARTH